MNLLPAYVLGYATLMAIVVASLITIWRPDTGEWDEYINPNEV